METIRDMRNRLKSINSTKQITASMRLISTRKVQKVRRRMEENKPYLEQNQKIIDGIINDFNLPGHPYFAGNDTGKPLIILITGDRGLCGGYNVNASKEAHTLLKDLQDAHLITIGSKGRDYFKRRQKEIIESYKGLSENPFFMDAQEIAAHAMGMFEEGTVNMVYLVSTEYFTMLMQTPKVVKLMPLEKRDANSMPDPSMVYDSGRDIYMKSAVTTYVSSQIYGAMLESAVCEQCARILGMDSAVKNSEKIIDQLTLQYNQMRQGAITQEIAEIVGGANATERKE